MGILYYDNEFTILDFQYSLDDNTGKLVLLIHSTSIEIQNTDTGIPVLWINNTGFPVLLSKQYWTTSIADTQYWKSSIIDP